MQAMMDNGRPRAGSAFLMVEDISQSGSYLAHHPHNLGSNTRSPAPFVCPPVARLAHPSSDRSCLLSAPRPVFRCSLFFSSKLPGTRAFVDFRDLEEKETVKLAASSPSARLLKSSTNQLSASSAAPATGSAAFPTPATLATPEYRSPAASGPGTPTAATTPKRVLVATLAPASIPDRRPGYQQPRQPQLLQSPEPLQYSRCHQRIYIRRHLRYDGRSPNAETPLPSHVLSYTAVQLSSIRRLTFPA